MIERLGVSLLLEVANLRLLPVEAITLLREFSDVTIPAPIHTSHKVNHDAANNRRRNRSESKKLVNCAVIDSHTFYAVFSGKRPY